MVGQHSPITLYTTWAKAGLWVWLWSVRASVGDPGDGSFRWVAPRWTRDLRVVDVPVVNLGYLPWLFELRVRTTTGKVFVGPSGRETEEVWVGPRSVRWVRMQATETVMPTDSVRFNLCTSARLAWLRTVECHRFESGFVTGSEG